MFERFFARNSGTQKAVRVEPPVVQEVLQDPRPANLASSSSMEEWSEFFNLPANGVVTRDTAMKFSAVFSCVTLLAGAIGSLPVRVIQKIDGKGNKVLSDHALTKILRHQPQKDMSAMVFMEGVHASGFLDGNEYAHIQYGRMGEVVGLRPLWDAHVEPFKRGSGGVGYSVVEGGKTRGFDQSEVLHFRTSPTIQGLKALSPLKCFSRAIGIGLQGDQFAEKFFEQGFNAPGYLSFDGEPSGEFVANEIRENWMAKRGLTGAHLPPVLTSGGKFVSLMTDPETAQLFQSRSFQILDVARAYGVPPHLIGETDKSTSWGSGIQAQTMQFYMLGLRRHIERTEGELTLKLLSDQEIADGICIEFDLDGFLRADQGARFDGNKIALGGTQHPGWMTANEIRESEGLPRLDDPEADKVYRPAQKSETSGNTQDDDTGVAPDPASPFQSVRGVEE